MGEPKSVLIIDDDSVTRRLLVRLVEKTGRKAVCAGDGQEAERLIDSGRGFDLVFLDLLMPHVSGWDLLAKLREQPGTRDVPVIILTGTKLSDTERTRILERAQEVVDKKDFSVNDFEKRLEKWL